MVEKSDKELATELTKAMLEHNQNIQLGNTASSDQILDVLSVARYYSFLLGTIEGSIDPLKEPDKK
ncbi:hypothetical protein [Levilactobacillus brevis]|uniref:hypothetical protein n=1 Tax=Levilactobacillus brevis TaxID=1580 RepID=UPI001142935D|nr:hypothetical protein [Levilactobacillus brevis]